jgi:small GTP-binding protein
MMVEELSDKKCLKIVIAGDGATGKTTISKRLNGTFRSDEELSMTTGLDFHTLEITEKDGKAVIWDLAGQEQFRSFQDTFFNEADIVILVYSVEWFPSYMNIDSWLSMIDRDNISKIYLIANKIDIENRAIHSDEVQEYVKSRGLHYYELSALTGEGLDEFEQDLLITARKMTNRVKDEEIESHQCIFNDEYIDLFEDTNFESKHCNECKEKNL